MGRPFPPESTPSRVGFGADVAWAAKALISQPSVPLVSLAVMLAATLIPSGSSRSDHHPALVMVVLIPASFAIAFFHCGWVGAERIFFQRHLEGKPVSVRHLVGLVPAFMGRFFTVGLLTFGVGMIVLMVAFAHTMSPSQDTPTPPAWLMVSFVVLFVTLDFLLTFVTAALAYTTRSAVRGLAMGVAMIHQTWPRSALYVLCPPLALNLLHVIHPVSGRTVGLAISSVLVLISLLAKGAIAAFYLRERGSYSEDGAAYIAANGVPAAGAPLGATLLGWTLIMGGLLGAVFGGFELLIYGNPLWSSNAQVDAEVRAAIVNSLVARGVGVGTYLIGLASGFALLTRRSWARPWIVCVSVAMLWEFGWSALRTGNPASHVWEMLRVGPGVIGGVRLLLVVGTPVVAVLAVLLLAVRVRRWLPPSPLGQWVVAVFVIAVAHGTISYQVWRQDPQRRQERYEQELAALAVEPGKGRLVIAPTFDGTPLDASFEAAVKLTLYEQKTKTHRELAARYRNGVIDVPDVETGIYGLSLGIDANTDNGFGSGWGMPGDFVSRGGERWDLLRNGLTVRQEVRVYRVMRLLKPEDTGVGLARGGSPPEFQSPLTIAWGPVPGARTYGYSIVRRSPDRSQRYIAGNQGPNPTWTVELPPTKPGETYVLDLHAYGKSGQVGIFEVQGAGWRGFDYQFRIAE